MCITIMYQFKAVYFKIKDTLHIFQVAAMIIACPAMILLSYKQTDASHGQNAMITSITTNLQRYSGMPVNSPFNQ